MEKVQVAIFDSDEEYSRRLTSYLNRKYGEWIEAEVFTKREHLMTGLSERIFDYVVSDDLDDIGMVQGILITDDMSQDGYYRFSSAKKLAKKLLEKQKINTTNEKSQNQTVAIYDPSGEEDQTDYAIAKARAMDGIYIGMEEFCSMDTENFWIEDLLFFIKQREEELVMELHDHIDWKEGTRIVPSARCYLDYRYLELEDYKWFFEKLKEQEIGPYIFDIGIGSVVDFKLFGLFDQILLFTSTEDKKKRKGERFLQLLYQQVPEIRDNIIFISKEDREQIFERYHYSKGYGTD